MLFGERNELMITEVLNGVRDEAKASWWGFDKGDATKAFQDAVNSKVKRLIIDNTGSEWIISPIFLIDNQEIIFEKGVTVKAKKNSFKAKGDSLFSIEGKKNILLKGEGNVTLEMNKKDYQNKTLYSHSEWRNILNLKSCENIKIHNLTLKSSGGDGIYVGAIKNHPLSYCRDIIIDNVICDDNHRQGISVISAENLLIRNCILKNTSGTEPQAGIDFEPNNRTPSNRLVNCVMENCLIEGNSGPGIEIRSPLDLSAPPHSLTFRNCEIKNNIVTVKSVTKGGKSPPGGYFHFINCKVKNENSMAMYVRLGHDGGKLILDGGSYEGGQSAVIVDSVSNIIFNNPRISSGAKFPAVNMAAINFPPCSLEKYISGNAIINGCEQDVFNYLKKMNMNETYGHVILPAQEKLKVSDKVKSKNICPSLKFRNSVDFLLFCRQKENIKLDISLAGIGKNKVSSFTDLSLTAPDGVKTGLQYSPEKKEISFYAETAGVYRLHCNAGNKATVQVNKSSVPVCVTKFDGILNLINPVGKLYFHIPPNTENFSVLVKGQGGEWFSATLWIDNKIIEKVDKHVGLFKFCETNLSNEAKTGCLEFSDAIDDVFILLAPPLTYIMSGEPNALPY